MSNPPSRLTTARTIGVQTSATTAATAATRKYGVIWCLPRSALWRLAARFGFCPRGGRALLRPCRGALRRRLDDRRPAEQRDDVARERLHGLSQSEPGVGALAARVDQVEVLRTDPAPEA